MTDNDERIVLNGVDALSGGYLTEPLTSQQLLDLAIEEFGQTSKSDRTFAKALSDKISQPHLGFDIDNLADPSEAGWGIIFAKGADERIKRALAPLIAHRAAQLGQDPKAFDYHDGMSVAEFLARQGVSRGIGNVSKVPYYLLIVGDPAVIPLRFQYELDTEYATGRLSFDTIEDYAAYVERLIDYELSANVPTSRQAVFWATANAGDPATELSSQLLARPLYDQLKPARKFAKELLLGADATKERLLEVFRHPQRPALLFTASHGLGFRRADPQQRAVQGALVTQAWERGDPITGDLVFAGSDLTGLDLQGMVHFAFACYSAGTPRHDDFAHGRSTTAPVIAEQPFIANLAQRALSQGALAFIGHIDRAWGYSIVGRYNEKQIEGYNRAVDRLLRGVPVAHALRDIHDRGTQLSASLLEELHEITAFGKRAEPLELANQWKERNDARAYVLVGDPVARLRVDVMA